VLHAYNPPGHALLEPTASDPRFARAAHQLVDCEGAACSDVTFRIDSYFGNRIAVSGDGGPARVVVYDFDAPGWAARVNGSPVPIVRQDDRFKAVDVPAGHWSLLFEYRPPYWFWLSAVSLLGVALFVAGPRILDRVHEASGQSELPARGPPST
jgi:hypothetical protein